MRRIWLIAAAASAYLLAAWMVAPGFYDGFAPQQPYNWVCPPVHVTSNLAPSSGHVEIKVIGGVSDAASAYTDDGQVVIGFLPGAFDATGKTVITVDIKPVSPCPKPPGITFATNAYQVTWDAPLVKSATLVTRYSDVIPAPSNLYYATSADGSWESVPVQSQAQPFTIDAVVNKFGYYAAGYPSNSVAHSSSNSQLLPIAIAVLIVGVLVAGVPLAIMRRRGKTDDREADDSDA
ncbi:MAG TPA: hypothetical protein VLR46_14725 [Candidatus Dormibacteraeota bacterium]|nr:hypothetical protein [Candidatus Dormibacteraeota bacterium]